MRTINISLVFVRLYLLMEKMNTYILDLLMSSVLINFYICMYIFIE